MFKTAVAMTLSLALGFAGSARAQEDREPRDTRQTGDPAILTVDSPWQFYVRGNVQQYENFFQAPSGGQEEDVLALMGEIGAALRLGEGPSRLYGSLQHLNYQDFDLEASNGVRLGLRSDARPHSFDVYGEQLTNRPTFDVGDEFDTADIRTLAGEYAFRFADDWQVSADGDLQQQEYEVTEARNNDYRSFGGAVRWRGSRLLSPEVGVRFGERDVDDPQFSYDQRDLYVQLRSSISPAVYLSLRYRNRSREYSTGDVLASNFGREDERRQIAATADWTFARALTLNLYAAHEDVDVNLPDRDFDTMMYLAGLTWRF